MRKSKHFEDDAANLEEVVHIMLQYQHFSHQLFLQDEKVEKFRIHLIW